MDYPGGFITKTAPTLNPALGNAAPGVWRLNDVLKNIKAGTWPAYDPYFDYTTLLLHGNGTNGGQNNTFLDSSSNNFTITRNGNTTQGTFSPFSQTGWSNYFDGSTSYLTIGYNVSLAPTSGTPYTAECWVYSTTASQTGVIFGQNTSGAYVWAVRVISGTLYVGTDAAQEINCGTLPVNAWTHIAMCYDSSGNILRAFVNGTQAGTQSSPTITNTSTDFNIGARASSLWVFSGYISNIRIVKGTALYTSNFTPSTTPLTAITNTKLLTCQSNRFVDNSASPFTFTVNGTPSVQAFSPFAPTAAYSASTVGGSGYFDGTGDYLTFPDSASFDYSTGDFTCDMWVYPTTVSGDKVLLQLGSYGSGQTGIVFLLSNGGKVFYGYNGGFGGESSGSVLINTWSYLSFVRSSGTLKMYVNGVEKYSTSFTSSIAPSTDFSIGSNLNPSGSQFSGYLTSVRLSNTARSSSVPTTPITNDGNTSLLLNFTNAAIIDNTAKNVLETVGNAQISTTQSKFGGGSLYFDGSGDYLVSAAGNTYISGTENFTIEGWLNLNSISSTQTIVSGNTNNSLFLRYGQGYTVTQGLNIGRQSVADAEYCAFTFTTGTWYHIAVCRSNGVIYFFVNGTQQTTQGSGVASYSFPVTATYNVGYFGVEPLNGYLDDLRITKGIARYTSNFTPQTSQWQDQ